MLTLRQEKLLKIIVEEYVKSAKPIGSKSLCQELNCSSATIRNEMSELENLELLEKTHISSGRIPSEKGYRYYVDNLMKPKELTGEDMLKLQTIFSNNSLVLSDAVSKSLEIVAELTNCTIISLGSSARENIISKVEVIPVTDQQLVALIVTDKGHVENKKVLLEDKISPLEVKQTVDLINKHISGTSLEEVIAKLEFEVKPIINDNVLYQRKLFDAFCTFINEFAADANIKMIGTTNILKQPEFNDVTKIREILDKFEDKEFIKNIKEDNDEIKVYIGSESEFDDNVSIIKTHYHVDGEEGTLALIGPTRLDYDRIVTLLDYIKKNLEK